MGETLLSSADDSDPVAIVSVGDRIWYHLENMAAASPSAKFVLLGWVTFFLWIVFTLLTGFAGGAPVLFRRLKTLAPSHGEEHIVTVEDDTTLDWPNTAYHTKMLMNFYSSPEMMN